jgi:hypothetical protein
MPLHLGWHLLSPGAVEFAGMLAKAALMLAILAFMECNNLVGST